MKRLFALGGAGAVAAAAVLLSGCLVIKAPSVAAQQNTIGNLQLSTTFCASNSAAGSTCTNLGNSGAPATAGDGQAMIGYRVSSAAVTPATITSTNNAVIFSANASYGAELQRLNPAPTGQKWVGYISQVRTFDPAVNSEFSVAPQFTLGQGADGSPFATPFAFQVVSGFRLVNANAASDRPAICAAAGNSSDIQPVNGGVATTICLDSQDPVTLGTSTSVATRDLGILAGGAAATVNPGQTATLTFQAKYSGTAAAGANFALSATTTVPAATATPNAINFVPQDNQQAPVSVAVNVPSGTPAGTYDVVLKAALANGQSRQGVGKITVNAVAAPPPPVTIVNNPVKVVKAPKRLNAKVRFRVAVGKNLQLLRLNVVGAPTKARINVKCVKGCSLNKASLSSGKSVNLAAFFQGKTLKPGVKLEIRVTKSGFLGQFFRYTINSSGVKGTECTISLKGKIGSCTPA